MDSSGVILTPEGTFSQLLRMKVPLGRRFLAGAQVSAGMAKAQLPPYHTNFLVSHLGKAFARLRPSRTIGDRLRHRCASRGLMPLGLAIKTVTKGSRPARTIEVGGAFRWAVTRVQPSACLWMHEFTPEAVADPSQRQSRYGGTANTLIRQRRESQTGQAHLFLRSVKNRQLQTGS